MFTFLDYNFDDTTHTAFFRYRGLDGILFTETIDFDVPAGSHAYDKDALDRALFLAFIILGTSYYKSHPTSEISLDYPLDQAQATFFSKIYQDGLSQFAFENHLTRSALAHFIATADNQSGSLTTASQPAELAALPVLATPPTSTPQPSPSHPISRLVLLSGGKDSLLTAEKLKRQNLPFRSLYISNSDSDLPELISAYGAPLVIRRHLDRDNLKKSAGLNGHVPVTLINESLALVEAILVGATEVYIGLGREGEEPHAYIGDLPVNHQWSKTPATQDALKAYIASHISPNLQVKSLLEGKSELEIAGEFVQLCWDKFGNKFSSCNVANYKQGTDNKSLKWCGKCPKCANSFLLFAPYLPLDKQPFGGRDLFTDPDLTDTFKGLLGVDGFMKPFECVGETAELREAYSRRGPSYGQLPFKV